MNLKQFFSYEFDSFVIIRKRVNKIFIACMKSKKKTVMHMNNALKTDTQSQVGGSFDLK